MLRSPARSLLYGLNRDLRSIRKNESLPSVDWERALRNALRMRSLLLGLTLVTGADARAPGRSPHRVPLIESVDENRWAESLLTQMTLEDRIGQVLAVRVAGDFSNVRSPAFVRAEHAVRDAHVGAVLVEGGSPAELALKTNALQRRARVPLLVMRDEPLTFGASRNVIEPAGVGATGDPAQAERAGAIAAREARAVGIHWITPPPASAYASDSAAAAGFAAAFARGAAQSGALTGGLVIRDATEPPCAGRPAGHRERQSCGVSRLAPTWSSLPSDCRRRARGTPRRRAGGPYHGSAHQ